MRAHILSREGLTEVIAGRGERILVSLESLSPEDVRRAQLSPEYVVAIWESGEEDDLPCAIAMNEEAQRDWMAWLMTYAQQLRPFTGYCRFLSLGEAADLLGERVSYRVSERGVL